MTAKKSDLKQIASLVDACEFGDLFIGELGWDNPPDSRPVRYSSPESGSTLTATPVAAKRGVVVYHCNSIPVSEDVENLDRQVSQRSTERLLIFSDGSEQQWRWPEPRKSGGTRYATHSHIAGASNPALLQRLSAVRFSLAEEDQLTVLTVRQRVRASFNADEVTKRFYNEFRSNQQELMADVTGIPSEGDRAWYSTLLLNRLMFIYFMQRKGFLNNDPNYLRNSLRGVQQLSGENRFFEYYRDFLIPLFHEGLGSEVRKYDDSAIAELIGDVPYINGGIFALHELEDAYEISISDATFESIFDFFDRYRWHLDERPTGNPEEINPEVLGHIFEKYVNQKEKGAYYTKEDVTGYMAGLTLVPAIIDKIVVATGQVPWDLLAKEPNRYLPESLKYGLDLVLPPAVAQADPTVYGVLDDHAAPDYGLPEERWREVVDRRDHVEVVRKRLADGAVASTDDAVTLNLDLQSLLLDWVADLANPDDIYAAWQALIGLKVVDPTCGSGAFLFAALDILDELYEAVLDRAEECCRGGESGPLKGIIEEAARHGSRSYYLLKTAVLSNLYGVDIMEEATEIARLRLFLALVARLDSRSDVEPLPDLDMNIRAGNLLVGCSTADDAASRFAASLLDVNAVDAIKESATTAAALYRKFVEAQQSDASAEEVFSAKSKFAAHVEELRDELDLLYSPETSPGEALDAWREVHRPFHWFVEFPEVFEGGRGFDVVIGNPPYISKSKIDYTYAGLRTQKSPDIFAPCLERSSALVGTGGNYAMIVPIALQFSERQEATRMVLTEAFGSLWCSTYGLWPSCLFTGAGVRSTIVVGAESGSAGVHTTAFRRFHSSFRPYLFDTNRYVPLPSGRKPSDTWPRISSEPIRQLFTKLTKNGKTLGQSIDPRGQYQMLRKSTAADFLSVFVDMPPAWDLDGNRIDQPVVKTVGFASEDERDLAFIVMAGRLALWWWVILGDDFNVTQGLMASLPISLSDVAPVAGPLKELAAELRAEQPRNPFVTKKLGLYGNYHLNNANCREITDRADHLILDALGLGHHWPDILLADAAYQKATSESGATSREWPFDWELGKAG